MNLPAYQALTATFTRLYHYQHLGAIASWDQAAKMPPGGNAARSAALAELDVLMHQTLTDKSLHALVATAQSEALDPVQRAPPLAEQQVVQRGDGLEVVIVGRCRIAC